MPGMHSANVPSAKAAKVPRIPAAAQPHGVAYGKKQPRPKQPPSPPRHGFGRGAQTWRAPPAPPTRPAPAGLVSLAAVESAQPQRARVAAATSVQCHYRGHAARKQLLRGAGRKAAAHLRLIRNLRVAQLGVVAMLRIGDFEMRKETKPDLSREVSRDTQLSEDENPAYHLRQRGSAFSDSAPEQIMDEAQAAAAKTRERVSGAATSVQSHIRGNLTRAGTLKRAGRSNLNAQRMFRKLRAAEIGVTAALRMQTFEMGVETKPSLSREVSRTSVMSEPESPNYRDKQRKSTMEAPLEIAFDMGAAMAAAQKALDNAATSIQSAARGYFYRRDHPMRRAATTATAGARLTAAALKLRAGAVAVGATLRMGGEFEMSRQESAPVLERSHESSSSIKSESENPKYWLKQQDSVFAMATPQPWG